MSEKKRKDKQTLPTKSPASRKDPQKASQGNLTGHRRKLKDLAVDAHNAVDKWDSLNSRAHNILMEIVNAKLEYIYQQNADSVEEGVEKVDMINLSQRVEPKCEALSHVCQSMKEVVNKLCSQADKTKGIRSLLQHQGDGDSVQFSSWTVHQFVDTLEALHTMYAKEWNLKTEICENVAHADTRPLLMFYSASWLHQPFIDSAMMVSALLQETGHDVS